MKLELLFHLAIVRPSIHSSSYERFSRSPFLFCETLLDHERNTCTPCARTHTADHHSLGQIKCYTRTGTQTIENERHIVCETKFYLTNIEKIASQHVRQKKLVNEWEWETNRFEVYTDVEDNDDGKWFHDKDPMTNQLDETTRTGFSSSFLCCEHDNVLSIGHFWLDQTPSLMHALKIESTKEMLVIFVYLFKCMPRGNGNTAVVYSTVDLNFVS